MAKGNPDYFGQSIFPQSGEFKEVTSSSGMTSMFLYDLFSVLYKGEVVGGTISLYGAAPITNLWLNLVINDLVFTATDVYDSFVNYGITDFYSMFKITKWDDVNGLYVITLSKGISLQNDLSIQIGTIFPSGAISYQSKIQYYLVDDN